MLVGKMEGWNTTLRVEQGFFKTHLTLEERGQTVEFELDKYKLEELIKLLQKCK
jgi:hypothetical protein